MYSRPAFVIAVETESSLLCHYIIPHKVASPVTHYSTRSSLDSFENLKTIHHQQVMVVDCFIESSQRAKIYINLLVNHDDGCLSSNILATRHLEAMDS